MISSVRVDAHRDLLMRWQAGEKQAGEQILAAYFDEIYEFFIHKVSEPADADDLAQETFVRLRQGKFRGDASVRTYLYTVARNAFHDHLRRRRTQGTKLDFEEISLVDLGTSPSQRLGRARQIQQLHEALHRLPVDTQLLVELRFWKGLDYAALSEVFGFPEGTIRMRLLRAHKALRKAMDQLGAGAANDAPDDALVRSISEPDLQENP